MPILNRVLALLLLCAACGPAAAENAGPQPACDEAQGYEHYRRPVHYSIRRGEAGFEYSCSLRKNGQRRKDPEVFRRKCEAFINRYIEILNRCEDAGIPAFMLDQSGKQESKKFLKYAGFVETG